MIYPVDSVIQPLNNWGQKFALETITSLTPHIGLQSRQVGDSHDTSVWNVSKMNTAVINTAVTFVYDEALQGIQTYKCLLSGLSNLGFPQSA